MILVFFIALSTICGYTVIHSLVYFLSLPFDHKLLKGRTVLFHSPMYTQNLALGLTQSSCSEIFVAGGMGGQTNMRYNRRGSSMPWGKKKRMNTVREDWRRHHREGDTWTESGTMNRILGSVEGKLFRQWDYPEQGFRSKKGYTCLWNRTWVWPEGRQNYMKKWGRRVGLEPTGRSVGLELTVKSL